MQISISSQIEPEQKKDPTREGLIQRKWLLTGGEEDGLSFRLFRSQYQEGENAFQSPRHHHAFQQIRWAETGAINYGPDQNIPEGDLCYFPRGAYYGPQVKDQGASWLLQFGFGPEMPGGGAAMDSYRRGVEALRARGAIENGMFVDTDPSTGLERRRSPAEVLVEESTGKKYSIPPEHYASPILMHPAAFDFYDAAPGVQIKHLGSFFDHSGPEADCRISVIRLSEGGLYQLKGNRAQIGWSVTAGLEIDRTTYPELTCFFSSLEEDVVLSCIESIDIFLIELPRLS